MSIHPLIETRRSKRGLDSRPLDADQVHALVEASRLAPSCQNKQSWRHLFVQDEKLAEAVRSCLTPGNYWAHPAPLYIVSAWSPTLGCQLNDQRVYGPFELGLSVQNILLQAHALGLVGHPMAGFDPVALKDKLGIGQEFTVMVVISVSHPGSDQGLNEKHREQEHGPRTLRPLEETVNFDTWAHKA